MTTHTDTGAKRCQYETLRADWNMTEKGIVTGPIATTGDLGASPCAIPVAPRHAPARGDLRRDTGTRGHSSARAARLKGRGCLSRRHQSCCTRDRLWWPHEGLFAHSPPDIGRNTELEHETPLLVYPGRGARLNHPQEEIPNKSKRENLSTAHVQGGVVVAAMGLEDNPR